MAASEAPTKPANGASIIHALGNAFASPSGGPVPTEKILEMLAANMEQLNKLVKEGKLNPQQVMQLKAFADKSKHDTAKQASSPPQPATSSQPSTSAAATPPAQPKANAGALKNEKDDSSETLLSSTSSVQGYPISQTLATTDPGPVVWPASQGRPTLSGGISGGRVAGTPAQIRGGEEVTLSSLDESKSRRKNTPGDQSMRRSIQDLVSSIDPNVKIEPEVEDLLLSIADEFIDSVTNFGCRLAKHRGGETLEVRDLQLHLERNHNIRIPGFASDETRISLSQPTAAPAPPAPPPATKKAAPGMHMTLRSHRLAQVQQAKRDAKLL